MTNKIISILGLCVIALAIVAYSLWNKSSPSAVVDTSNAKAMEQESESAEPQKNLAVTVDNPIEKQAMTVEEPAVDTVAESESTDEQDETLCKLANKYNDWFPKDDGYMSESFMRDVKEWAFAHGYFETEYSKGSLGIKKQSDYDYYDIEDLEDMAKAGDSMANLRLAYRLYLKGDKDNIERAQPYCDRAIIDGYTALIMCKTAYITNKIYAERRKENGAENQANKELEKEFELEFRAWSQVSKHLGDELGVRFNMNIFDEKEFELTEAEVSEHAQTIVADIKDKRQQLGIGDIEYPPVPELLTYILDHEDDSRDKLNACFQ